MTHSVTRKFLSNGCLISTSITGKQLLIIDPYTGKQINSINIPFKVTKIFIHNNIIFCVPEKENFIGYWNPEEKTEIQTLATRNNVQDVYILPNMEKNQAFLFQLKSGEFNYLGTNNESLFIDSSIKSIDYILPLKKEDYFVIFTKEKSLLIWNKWNNALEPIFLLSKLNGNSSSKLNYSINKINAVAVNSNDEIITLATIFNSITNNYITNLIVYDAKTKIQRCFCLNLAESIENIFCAPNNDIYAYRNKTLYILEAGQYNLIKSHQFDSSIIDIGFDPQSYAHVLLSNYKIITMPIHENSNQKQQLNSSSHPVYRGLN